MKTVLLILLLSLSSCVTNNYYLCPCPEYSDPIYDTIIMYPNEINPWFYGDPFEYPKSVPRFIPDTASFDFNWFNVISDSIPFSIYSDTISIYCDTIYYSK